MSLREGAVIKEHCLGHVVLDGKCVYVCVCLSCDMRPTDRASWLLLSSLSALLDIYCVSHSLCFSHSLSGSAILAYTFLVPCLMAVDVFSFCFFSLSLSYSLTDYFPCCAFLGCLDTHSLSPVYVPACVFSTYIHALFLCVMCRELLSSSFSLTILCLCGTECQFESERVPVSGHWGASSSVIEYDRRPHLFETVYCQCFCFISHSFSRPFSHASNFSAICNDCLEDSRENSKERMNWKLAQSKSKNWICALLYIAHTLSCICQQVSHFARRGPHSGFFWRQAG